MDLSSIFKAYDVRGTYPDQINEKKVKRIAMAFVRFTGAKTVAVGRDVRLSGPKLQKAVIDGLTEAGANVIDIGAVPTEMLYFATGFYHYDGGIQVSASHNPAEFNGLKIVGKGADAVSVDNGLKEIQRLAESEDNLVEPITGTVESKDVEEDYFDFLTKFVEFDAAPNLKIVANNNFGLSGPLASRFLARLNSNHINLIELNFEPDGTFPKGRPDPLRVENRKETSELIVESKADFGVAWDADGDRCYISDERGEAIEGCHLTALLSVHLLAENKGEKVIYDPRNVWAVEDSVKSAGGVPVLNKAGHTFISNRMVKEDALFAGEMSGHFYFRDFYYTDNGLIPFIIFLNLVATDQKPVSEIIKPYREKYFVSGEINFVVEDKDGMMKKVEAKYADGSSTSSEPPRVASRGGQIDRTDGLSISFDDWRLNLRPSNTENLLRLNLEAKSREICDKKTAEVSALIS